MTARAGRQDDGWMPDAKRMRTDGVTIKAIAKACGVSRFRVQCVLIADFREKRRQQINDTRARHAQRPRQPSPPRALTREELERS